MADKKTITIAIMDAPYESGRSTTTLRLIDIAARRGYNINVFAYEGAVLQPFSAQKPHPNAVHGRDVEQENHFIPKDAIAALMREAEKQRALLVAYLKQEGLFSDTESAIVDVGWNGKLQDSLGVILEEEGHRPMNGFYVGLNHRDTRHEKGERWTYLFDLRHDPKWRLPIPQPL